MTRPYLGSWERGSHYVDVVLEVSTDIRVIILFDNEKYERNYRIVFGKFIMNNSKWK